MGILFDADSELEGLGWILRYSISDKLSAAAAAGLCATVCEVRI